MEYFNEGPISGVTVESGGGIAYVVRSGVVKGLTVSSHDHDTRSDGSLLVYGGGLMVDTDLLKDTVETVSSGGRDYGSEVAGFVTVSRGGRMRDVTVVGGIIADGGAALSGVTISSGGFVEADFRIFACDLHAGAKLDVRSQTQVSGLTVHAGAVLEVLDADYVSAAVSSGELYGYTRSGGPAVEVFALAGDTSGLICTVSSGYIGGADITFVRRGADSMVHAVAGFAAAPAAAAAEPAYSLQSAHAELGQAQGPGAPHRALA